MPSRDDVVAFRRWIIQKLKESSWVTFRGDSVEDVARRLGLQPELLREAQAELSKECERRGQIKWRLGGPAYLLDNSGAAMQFSIAKRVYADWQAYCEMRKVESSTLLRSLIHRMLTLPGISSRVRERRWRYRGSVYSTTEFVGDPKLRKKMRLKDSYPYERYRLGATITAGAKQALIRKAKVFGAKPSAMVRAAVLDLLEGEIKKLNIIGSAAEMWDDPDRYWNDAS